MNFLEGIPPSLVPWGIVGHRFFPKRYLVFVELLYGRDEVFDFITACVVDVIKIGVDFEDASIGGNSFEDIHKKIKRTCGRDGLEADLQDGTDFDRVIRGKIDAP